MSIECFAAVAWEVNKFQYNYFLNLLQFSEENKLCAQ